jgi:hypothetical protein
MLSPADYTLGCMRLQCMQCMHAPLSVHMACMHGSLWSGQQWPWLGRCALCMHEHDSSTCSPSPRAVVGCHSASAWNGCHRSRSACRQAIVLQRPALATVPSCSFAAVTNSPAHHAQSTGQTQPVDATPHPTGWCKLCSSTGQCRAVPVVFLMLPHLRIVWPPPQPSCLHLPGSSSLSV